MAKTSMTQPVRIAATGEVTTLTKLASEGRLTFSTCVMDGPKRQGERKSVTRYFADLVDPSLPEGTSTGWEIGETAYKSRTGQTIDIGR
jgi:hypothetical protein